MKDEDTLEEASTFAFERLNRVGGQIHNLPIELQTFIRVYAAHGVIENGALDYFYERDWPGKPAYSEFSEAYRRIGAVSAAECIEETERMLRLERPEASSAKRERAIAKLKRESSSRFETLSIRICCHQSVWQSLTAYVNENRHAFVP
jgi:deoxyribodipyrimidine photolyase